MQFDLGVKKQTNKQTNKTIKDPSSEIYAATILFFKFNNAIEGRNVSDSPSQVTLITGLPRAWWSPENPLLTDAFPVQNRIFVFC